MRIYTPKINIFSKRSYCSKLTKTHYDVLGLTPKASSSEIKAAFYEKSKLHHPDRNGPSNEEEFIKINDAYQVLSNEEQKRFYDSQINSDRNFESNFNPEYNFRPEMYQAFYKQRRSQIRKFDYKINDYYHLYRNAGKENKEQQWKEYEKKINNLDNHLKVEQKVLGCVIFCALLFFAYSIST